MAMDMKWLIALGLSMRILFTDFDGVVHPGPTVVTSQTHFCWLPQLARLLAPWDDIELVIHSTWRHQYDLAELREMLGSLGRAIAIREEFAGPRDELAWSFLDGDPHCRQVWVGVTKDGGRVAASKEDGSGADKGFD